MENFLCVCRTLAYFGLETVYNFYYCNLMQIYSFLTTKAKCRLLPRWFLSSVKGLQQMFIRGPLKEEIVVPVGQMKSSLPPRNLLQALGIQCPLTLYLQETLWTQKVINNFLKTNMGDLIASSWLTAVGNKTFYSLSSMLAFLQTGRSTAGLRHCEQMVERHDGLYTTLSLDV